MHFGARVAVAVCFVAPLDCSEFGQDGHDTTTAKALLLTFQKTRN